MRAKIKLVETVDQLTLGALIDVFTDQKFWPQLQLSDIDRGKLKASLCGIRKIRSQVMHFSDEALQPKDLATLTNFAKFVQGLCRALSALGSRGANPQQLNSPEKVDSNVKHADTLTSSVKAACPSAGFQRP